MTSNITEIIAFPKCKDEDQSYSLTKDARIFYVFLTGVRILMTASTIILNLVFLATLVHHKKTRQKTSSKFLMFLSTIDLLQGATCWPIVTYISISWYNSKQECFWGNMANSVGYGVGFATVSAIFLIALDQYLAILHPFLYVSKVTACRLLWPTVLLNVGLYVINVVGRFKVVEVWVIYRYLLIALTLLIIMAMICIYARIMQFASMTVTRIVTLNRDEGRQTKTRARAIKSTFIVLVATISCYTPFMAYTVYENLKIPTSFSKTFIRLPFEMLAMSSSVVDPIIYYCRLRSLRIATRAMMYSICRSHRRRSNSIDVSEKTTGQKNPTKTIYCRPVTKEGLSMA